MSTTSEAKNPENPLTILVHAIDATGHLMACVGFAQALAARGHRLVFLLNAKFAGQYARYGFEEVHLVQKNPPKPLRPDNVPEDKKEEEEKENSKESEVEESPARKRAKAILGSGVLSGKPTLEKMKDSVALADPFGKSLLDTCIEFNPQISEAIKQYKPDAFILDHFILCPAFLEPRIPWFKLCSSNPLGLYSQYSGGRLPPGESGYSPYSPVDSPERALWSEFAGYKAEFANRFRKYQERLYQHFEYPYTVEDLPAEGSTTPKCKFGLIYGYPKELDYVDDVPKENLEGTNFIRIDAFSREEPKSTEAEKFELPEHFRTNPDGKKLIYFSLGSVAVFDVPLVQKLVGFLAKTDHLTIVSKGPLADEYELPGNGSNVWGQENLPQTALLPLVDLVVTHGGNNTVTEAVAAGKPLLVLPIFAEQADNAQRVEDKRFGARLNPYEVEEGAFLETVERILADREMAERLTKAKERIQKEKSKEKAALKVEEIIRAFYAEKKDE